MKNNDKISISAALTAATCTLLGTTALQPVQAQEDPGWDFNTSLLYYGEDNDRIQDLSLKTLSRRTFVDDRILSLGLTIDALTGATPNGALPQSFPQTFTKPSGKNTFTTPPGEFPIDDSFRDTRVAISANWDQPLGRLYAMNVGVSASAEFDYLHLGLNAKLSRDFNNRNTTLSGGFAFASDQLDPVGGIPDPLTQMRNVRDDDDDGNSGRSSTDTKEILDLVLGVTQVMSRNFLMQFNYSYSDSSGYLSDPYKILTAIDANGDAIFLPQVPGVEGPSHLNYYEHRPDSRSKHSLYAQGKYYMSGKVLDASYRYMTDDWEIDSHTVDLRLRWPIGDTSYLEPHLRFYTQTAAEFYQISLNGLNDGEPLPEYASADYRLGDFDALTAGLKFGWKTGGGNDMSVRLELYSQSGNVSSSDLIGSQADRDVYPDMDAIIFQYSYQFGK
ncbi:MAG: DUF3570 domain-containing protein [Woeseiaceae bacterium]|nr:DUF3570 domain-containing protein [Woeseiaceae bacterium]